MEDLRHVSELIAQLGSGGSSGASGEVRRALYTRSRLLRLMHPVSPSDPLFTALIPYTTMFRSDAELNFGCSPAVLCLANLIRYFMGRVSPIAIDLYESASLDQELLERIEAAEGSDAVADPLEVCESEDDLCDLFLVQSDAISTYRSIDGETLLDIAIAVGEVAKAAWLMNHVPSLLRAVTTRRMTVFAAIAAQELPVRRELAVALHDAMSRHPTDALWLIAVDTLLNGPAGVAFMRTIGRSIDALIVPMDLMQQAERRLTLECGIPADELFGRAGATAGATAGGDKESV